MKGTLKKGILSHKKQRARKALVRCLCINTPLIISVAYRAVRNLFGAGLASSTPFAGTVER